MNLSIANLIVDVTPIYERGSIIGCNTQMATRRSPCSQKSLFYDWRANCVPRESRIEPKYHNSFRFPSEQSQIFRRTAKNKSSSSKEARQLFLTGCSRDDPTSVLLAPSSDDDECLPLRSADRFSRRCATAFDRRLM